VTGDLRLCCDKDEDWSHEDIAEAEGVKLAAAMPV